jgi:hypothetical protein
MRVLLALAISAMPAAAFAGFDSWTSETKDDPFSGGKSIIVGNMATMRSGVLILCDTSKIGITIRSVPGFNSEKGYSGFIPTLEFAVDGKKLFEEKGEIGAVGDNLAMSEAELSADHSKEFVTAFSTAKKQIAVKDGISQKPMLMNAQGTTKTGKELSSCLDGQAK